MSVQRIWELVENLQQITRKSRCKLLATLVGVVCVSSALLWFPSDERSGGGIARAADAEPDRVEKGREVFRYDTFGDEQNWTDRLKMHQVIESALDPITALTLGLKVDVDALPDEVVEAIVAGQVDLTDPATTVALISLDAVVGVVGKVETIDGRLRLTRVGITCALCHSTVDDSFAPGIGHRLDGWANRDLNPGAIIAASPAVP